MRQHSTPCQLRQIKNTSATPPPLLPRGCCLDREIWQGWLLLRDLLFCSIAAKRPEGSRGGGGAPAQGRGWGTRWGTPIIPCCVPALLHSSRVLQGLFLICRGGSFQHRCGALAWAAQVLAEGPGWAVGHGEGAVGCCWRRKPPKRLPQGPPTPPVPPSSPDAASRLLPLHSLVTTFCCVT